MAEADVLASRSKYGNNKRPVIKGRRESTARGLFVVSLPEVTVIRETEEKMIPENDVVRGDLVVLTAGCRVPADLRIVSSKNMKIDMSEVGGPSCVGVGAEDCDEDDATYANNMAWFSTIVISGEGLGIAVSLIRDSRAMTVRHRASSPAIFKGKGLRRTKEMFVKGKRALKRHSLIVKSLDVVNHLSHAKSIVLDINQFRGGNARISRFYYNGQTYDAVEGKCEFPTQVGDVEVALIRALLAGNVSYGANLGDTIDILLTRFGGNVLAHCTNEVDAAKAVQNLRQETPLLFSTYCRGDMLHVCLVDDRALSPPSTSEGRGCFPYPVGSAPGLKMHVKGNPDTILTKCRSQLRSDGKCGKFAVEDVRAAVDCMRDAGMTVVAVAFCSIDPMYGEMHAFDADETLDSVNVPMEDMVFVALIGVQMDMLEETRQGVDTLKESCMQIVVGSILSENETRALCQQAHLDVSQYVDALMNTNDNLIFHRRMYKFEDIDSEGFLSSLVRGDNVVVTGMPAQARRHIVDDLKAADRVTLAIGDSSVDAPTLACASVGIALGVSGSDVAKSAADVILANDSLLSLAQGLNEIRFGKVGALEGCTVS